jgi:xylulokinase
MYLLAIDIGSTSIKAVIFDYEGNIISIGRRKTEVFYENENSENNAFWMPDNIWRSVCGAVKDSIGAIDKPESVKSVTVTGFACDGVPIDEKGNWIYPFISWHDTRCIEQIEWVKENLDSEKIYKINGQNPWLHNTILRNVWIKKHRPDIYGKIYKWLLIEDYVNFKLCGKISTDYSLASTTLVFDQKKLAWSKELFEMFDIDMEIYPDPKPSSTFLGEVSKEAALKTGLKTGTPVILGGLDGLCGVYATAGDQQEDLVGIIGTYEHYHKCLDEPILKKEGLTSSIICQAHVIKGKYGVYGVAVSSGILEWFRGVFCEDEEKYARRVKKNFWDVLMNKAASSPVGSKGVFMLPDMFGSACPIQDNYSRGVFVGISSTSKKEDFIRAVVEGLNYKGYELYETIHKYTDSNGRKAIVSGGATRNEFWMQLKSDMLGTEVEVPDIEEATPLGAAMIGGIGVGIFKDFKDAFDKIKRKIKRYYPDEKNHRLYLDYYNEIYSKIYPSCKDINTSISTKIT